MEAIETWDLEQPGGWEQIVNANARAAEQIRKKERLEQEIKWDTEIRESYQCLMRMRKRNARNQANRYWKKCEAVLMGAFGVVFLLAAVILLEIGNVIPEGISIPATVAGGCVLSFLTGWYIHMLTQRRSRG